MAGTLTQVDVLVCVVLSQRRAVACFNDLLPQAWSADDGSVPALVIDRQKFRRCPR